MKLPKRGRRRCAWLEGYAEARRRHYTPVDDGDFFTTLERSFSQDPLMLYRIDCLRHERDTRTGAYTPHLMERMGMRYDDGTEP